MSFQGVNFYKFKDIPVIHSAKDLVDIVLSQTQRKTPTEIHRNFKICRIRRFYLRKIKYCQQTIDDTLKAILEKFPRLDDIHPFYADLFNTLYSRDHYKLALSSIAFTCRTVKTIAKEYVQILKLADSLYKCKMLKRAGLGRMCRYIKKLGDVLAFLEEVRKHMGRLPHINPHTRTLLLTGYPNVGKSSFINQVSHADVEVQPFAFTTKSLYVGHFDFSYCRWQIIDTPGILDRPLEERNTIEMTAVTALAHLQSSILYLLDISETCGYSIAEQIALFESIKCLFRNKPLLIVLNKCDVCSMDSLSTEVQSSIKHMEESVKEIASSVDIVQTSTLTGEGVDEAKSVACVKLLEQRVQSKSAAMQPSKLESVLNRVYIPDVTVPSNRPPSIPQSVMESREKKANGLTSDEKLETESAIQERCGGAGVYSMDWCKFHQLTNPEWRNDVVPEFFEGRNVADFVDVEIDEKIRQLEVEEELLLRDENDVDEFNNEWNTAQSKLKKLHYRIAEKRLTNQLKTKHNGPTVHSKRRSMQEISEQLGDMGISSKLIAERRVSVRRGRSLSRVDTNNSADAMDVEKDFGSTATSASGEDRKKSLIKRMRSASSAARSKSRNRSASLAIPKDELSMPNKKMQRRAESIKRRKEKQRNTRGMVGEADRFIGTKMPRHLFSGKRGIGKSDRR